VEFNIILNTKCEPVHFMIPVMCRVQ